MTKDKIQIIARVSNYTFDLIEARPASCDLLIVLVPGHFPAWLYSDQAAGMLGDQYNEALLVAMSIELTPLALNEAQSCARRNRRGSFRMYSTSAS